MNPNYQEFKFPHIRAQPFATIFKPYVPPEAIDLVATMLFYVPTRRCKAIEVLLYLMFRCLFISTFNISYYIYIYISFIYIYRL